MADEPMTREAAQAALADVMQNPSNPHHEGYKRNDPAAVAYVDGLYKRIPGADAKVALTEGVHVGGETSPGGGPSEEIPAWMVDIQQELGGEFRTELQAVQGLSQSVFGGDAMAEVNAYHNLLAAGYNEQQIFHASRAFARALGAPKKQ